ncbi:hypothetical protein [Anaeromyxobacter oryzae]|uniref:Uncharacterized protein n=1 Tax=Anaeromyxobacter oryzae TaxID=2918170 RepID=A0ABM7X2H5_9BACT|nr:hypothetical protein [Anaeromyxobacter oryzae]BDG05990.1 hypothetical protein AMOR_49860 [Anaeromyxobacter oryzae]
MFFPSTAALLAALASVVVVSVGGAALQARFPRAPLAGLLAVAVAFTLTLAVAKAGGPLLRSVAEPAVGEIVGLGLPASAALGALVLLRRRGPRLRVGVALAAGAIGTVYAILAALAVMCGVIGECL